MKSAFLVTDFQSKRAGFAHSGATAITCLVGREDGVRKVWSANAGDARAVMCREVINGHCCDRRQDEEGEIALCQRPSLSLVPQTQ